MTWKLAGSVDLQGSHAANRKCFAFSSDVSEFFELSKHCLWVLGFSLHILQLTHGKVDVRESRISP